MGAQFDTALQSKSVLHQLGDIVKAAFLAVYDEHEIDDFDVSLSLCSYKAREYLCLDVKVGVWLNFAALKHKSSGRPAEHPGILAHMDAVVGDLAESLSKTFGVQVIILFADTPIGAGGYQKKINSICFGIPFNER